VVSTATVDRSSGYADVDSAVIDAIRRWRFTPASGGGSVKGVIPYVIKTR
jgi:TonB family protein